MKMNRASSFSEDALPGIDRCIFLGVLLPDECCIYISGNTEFRSIDPNVGGCAAAEACTLYEAAGDLDLIAIVQADVVDLVLILCRRRCTDRQVAALNTAYGSPSV